jgi:hypothetical protein
LITVEVRLHGNLRRFSPQGVGAMRMALAEGARIEEVVERLHADHQVGVAAIGGRAVAVSAVLEDGMAVDLYPHLDGG